MSRTGPLPAVIALVVLTLATWTFALLVGNVLAVGFAVLLSTFYGGAGLIVVGL